MKVLRNQEGSALLFIIIISVVFSLLGTALLASALNGASRNVFRENDIQATYAAKQGIEYFIAHINKNFMAYQGLSPDQYNLALYQYANEYPYSSTNAEVGKKIMTDISSNHYARVSVKSISTLTSDPEDLRRRVVLESRGFANGQVQVIDSTYLIDADAKILKYTLGATNDLKIHGGLSILGDVFVNRHLVVTPHSYFTSGGKRMWPSTDYPSIEPAPGTSEARLTVGGKLFELNETGREAAGNNWNGYRTNFNPADPSKAHFFTEVSRLEYQKLFSQLTAPPILTSDAVKYTPIDITSYRPKYYYNMSTASLNGEVLNKYQLQNLPTASVNGSEVNVISGVHKPYQDVFYQQADNKPIYLHNDLSFRRLSLQSPGNVFLFSSTNNSRKEMDFGNGAYIKAPTVTITHHGNSNGRVLRIKGPLFIDGNLVVDLAHVEFDSTVYVTGGVSMTRSAIRGFEKEDANGTKYLTSLAVFSEKSIDTYNINLHADMPSGGLDPTMVLRAFLYSNSFIDMYGQGSLIHIEGGIVGKDVNFKVMKGNTKTYNPGGYWQPDSASHEWFEPNQRNIPPARSRFRIVYNKDLIANPPEGMPIDSVRMVLEDQKIK